MTDAVERKLAVVTGASSGIGYELARQCALAGYDLVVVADEPQIHLSAKTLRGEGGEVTPFEADLSTIEGVDRLCDRLLAMARPVDALLANAGHGIRGAFLDQDFRAARHVIDTNITGTVYLIHRIGGEMRRRGAGRILITGSIAGFIPGSFHAVYNASKAFLDNFSWAIRTELKDTGVTVTCLMPGATDTAFFERADLMDTQLGQSRKDDPAQVARQGFEAMERGDGEVVTGWRSKATVAMAGITPASVLAEQHRRMAEPGSASRQ